MKTKLVLSLSAIAVSLLASSVISVIEYRKMSSYVSDLIAEDIKKISLAQNLEEVCSAYNLDILTVIGVDSLTTLPEFDADGYVGQIMELPNSKEVLAAYEEYVNTSMELKDSVLTNFMGVRDWYFDILQPKYNALNEAIDGMNSDIYNDLKANSEDFDSGFYRSQVPGIVAVGVGLLLILLLLFFLLTNYVKPIYKMLEGLKNFKSFGRSYTYDFDGDDQLKDLNAGIADLATENGLLHKRIEALKSHNQQEGGNGE